MNLANSSSQYNPSISCTPSRDEVHNRGHERCNEIETTISGFEEALVDCSHCLKIVKDIRPKLLAACCPKDDSECYAFRKKLQQEQERHSVTRSLLEKASVELETCKNGLDKAEKERTEALVYSTEVEALREKLSAKEREVLDLREELSLRDRDLGLRDRLREGSSRGETPRKRCSCADTTLPNRQSFAQEVARVHRREDLRQESFLSDAQQRAERYDKLHLAGLQLGLQASAEDANHDRVEVGEAHASEISQRELHQISLIPSGKTEEVDGAGTIDNAGLQSQNDAATRPQPDGVTIPDAIEPEQVLPQAVGQESNGIPHLIAAGPEITPHRVGSHLEIVGDDAAGHPSDDVSVPDVDLHQAAHRLLEDGVSDGSQAAPPSVGSETVPQQVDPDSSPDLDTSSDSGSTGFVQDHTESLQLDGAAVGHPSDDVSVPDVLDVKPAQHEATHQHSDAQVAPPFNASSSSPLNTSGRYTRSNQKLIFILSTVVAFIAIAVQYELGPEMSHKSTGLIRPGWARHRKEGWKRKGRAGKYL